MPTRNVSLTAVQDSFVERLVASGEYQNASEAIRAGLRALQQRRREDAARVHALRAAVSAGVDDLERGDHDEVDAADLRAYVRGLGATQGGGKPRRATAARRR